DQRQIAGHYPDEIQPLVTNLNTMLSNDQARLTRYRNALGDLAHSMKTPMAILHGLANNGDMDDKQRRSLRHHDGRMNDILDYQLQKAATAGKRSLARSIAVTPVIERLGRALTKVYAGKGTHIETQADTELTARIDEGDLTELLGVCMDNAAKYGNGHVHVTAAATTAGLRIVIDDDGPGFPEQP